MLGVALLTTACKQRGCCARAGVGDCFANVSRARRVRFRARMRALEGWRSRARFARQRWQYDRSFV